MKKSGCLDLFESDNNPKIWRVIFWKQVSIFFKYNEAWRSLEVVVNDKLCSWMRKRYEESVLQQDTNRDSHQCRELRGVCWRTFIYLVELQRLPEFALWILEEVRRKEWCAEIVDPMIVDTTCGLLEKVASYKSMYIFGNHFWVINAERSLKTSNNSVVATFCQVC